MWASESNFLAVLPSCIPYCTGARSNDSVKKRGGIKFVFEILWGQADYFVHELNTLGCASDRTGRAARSAVLVQEQEFGWLCYFHFFSVKSYFVASLHAGFVDHCNR